MTAAVTHAGPAKLVQGDREQLTHLLSGLTTRLGHLDRRLADLTWPEYALADSPHARSALEAERERLSERLAVLSSQFNDPTVDSRVGTCPYCGYPSLASGLCAFCRPHSGG